MQTLERQEWDLETASMSDRDIAPRLDAYNPDGAFGRAVAEAWAMAGPIITDVQREMIIEKLDHPHLYGLDPELAAAKNRDRIVNHMMETLHYKFTHELDAEWVRRIASEAIGITRHALPIPGVVASKIATASRAAARIQESIADPALAARLAATLHQLCSFELEITLWQVGELRRRAAASDRARQSETFHHDVSETLVVALKDAQVLHDLTDTTISSTRETLEQVAEIAAAARQSADAMNSAARTTAGLNNVLAELNEQLGNATTVTFRADDEMNHTVGTSSTLSEEVQAITSIVGVIREIAGQTNLLALNATIEAARAGDAGRGFAVVAQEVKSLAAQTARATDAIAGRIVGIQSANAQSVASVTSVQQTIAAVRATAERMAEKVAGQSVQVSQIAEAVDETAITARTVSRLVESITERTRTTVEDVVRLGQGFGRVDEQLARMDAVTTRFVGAIAA